MRGVNNKEVDQQEMDQDQDQDHHQDQDQDHQMDHHRTTETHTHRGMVELQEIMDSMLDNQLLRLHRLAAGDRQWINQSIIEIANNQ